MLILEREREMKENHAILWAMFVDGVLEEGEGVMRRALAGTGKS